MNRFIATFFYVGLLRPGPGTWGSLAALPTGWLLHVLGGPLALVVGIVASFLLGLRVTAAEVARTGVEDPSEIVLDEVAGQWLAILPISIGAWHVGADILALWPGWIAAFGLFRLFDIRKPGPVGWADRRGDPLGVMLDDVIAGAITAVCVVLLAVIWHVFLI